MREAIVIVGATGMFGAHLAEHLAAVAGTSVVCVGRDRTTLTTFARAAAATAEVCDRDDDAALARVLARHRPFAVVDCAGPFQAYGKGRADPYRLARHALASGAHYIDIADAPDFVAGIAALDGEAKAKGLSALSGASSTPALSSAVADRMAQRYTDIESIDVAIVPGNRTRRGRSVVSAILGQIGAPIEVWRNGTWKTLRGWSDTRRIDLAAADAPRVVGRPASLVDTPDLRLFPRRYHARSVTFRAGLELAILHRTLAAIGWLRSHHLLPPLEPCAGIFYRAAGLFERFGSDFGGMKVEMLGKTAAGDWERATWDLIAPDGQGPKIPTLPVAVVIDKLRRGAVAPGARPCVGECDLDAFAPYFAARSIVTEMRVEPQPTIFAQALGDALAALPEAVRDLHRGFGCRVYTGTADVEGPEGTAARFASWLAGFPPPGRSVPVSVEIDATPGREVWQRTFGGHVFRSVLSFDARSGSIIERFGPNAFTLALNVRDGALHFPVARGRLFGVIPLPRAVTPMSETREFADAAGHFHFDVAVSLPGGRRIAHYRGRLQRAADTGRCSP